MEILLTLLGMVLGALLIYFVLRPKLSATQQINSTIEEQNKIILAHNQKLIQQQEQLNDEIPKLLTAKGEAEARKEEILASIQDLQAQAQTIYDTSYNLMQEKMSQAAENLSLEYQEEKVKFEQEFLQIMRESAEELAAALALKREELRVVEAELQTLRAKSEAAIEAFKREEEKALELDKYKIILSKEDLIEINRLREIAPYFRNPRAIYKIIWESYYRNNTTELVNRIVGTITKTGIYKITNLQNQKSYIGQAADLGNRIKDHIKAGLGIDTPSNKLYIAMMKDGVENFSFEVLEECPRAALNDRETYWIDFYKSQDHGYNMTRGGAALTGAGK